MIRKLCILLLALPAMGFAQTPKNIVLTWIQPTNTSQWPICSATVTTMCADHLELSDVTVPASPVIVTSSIAPTATGYTYPVPSGNTYSTRLYSLVLVYKDDKGVTGRTVAATCGNTNTNPPCAVNSIPVSPPPNVTNFTGTVQ